MTSFERSDAALLVEHFLPSLLGAGNSLSEEPKARTLFFGELGTALESLQGRLTVISSLPREIQESRQYPWLWRYVSHFMVGAKSRAIQHAKLWAFHWRVGDQEFLELHVSSTNLTPSAFKAQVQAGWRVSLQLGQHATVATRRTWGRLVPFLDALGESAGDEAQARVQRLVNLLGCVECPQNVTFVASIPGQGNTARQLSQFNPVELHVLAPTIGEWGEKSVSAWTSDVGVAPGKVHLKWIAHDHPWAASNGWSMSAEACSALTAQQVRLERLPNGARFVAQHSEGDHRWSHAKLYLIRSANKRKRRLLVTSANWSPSAWGAGKQAPRNFELGVVIETDWTGLETMGQPFGEGTTPFCCMHASSMPDEPQLQWAQACWDGKQIRLLARSSDSSTPITATVSFNDAMDKSVALAGGAALMAWKHAKRAPLTARFTQGTDTLEVGILDLRSPEEFTNTPLPEVDPALDGVLREAFLLQRYGGPAVEEDAIPGPGRSPGKAGGAAPTADYSVQAWLDARTAFGIVDNWRATLKRAKTEPNLLRRALLDGEQLRQIYARRAGAAAELVAEELGWRIDKEE